MEDIHRPQTKLDSLKNEKSATFPYSTKPYRLTNTVEHTHKKRKNVKRVNDTKTESVVAFSFISLRAKGESSNYCEKNDSIYS